MKKIFGILITVLITTAVFGQINYNKTSTIQYGTWSDKTNLVHFTTENGRYEHFYILAYEPNFRKNKSNTTRNVYLYSVITNPSHGAIFRDHYNWVKASDDVVFEGYFKDGANYLDVDFFTYNENSQNSSHSSVRKIGYDVEFTLDISKSVNGDVTIYQKKIRLKCVGDGGSDGYLYKVVR